MTVRKIIFAVLIFAPIMPIYGASLLQATSFPKTFDQDVQFQDKVAVLTQGYGVYDSEYDADGRCISGCAYVGITLQDDEKLTQQAILDSIQDLVKNHGWTLDPVTGIPQPPYVSPEEQIQQYSTANKYQTTGAESDDLATMVSNALANHTGQKTSGASNESLGCISNVCISSTSDIPYGHPLGRRAVITSHFGRRQHPVTGKYHMHKGIDLAAGIGTNVYSPANGTVRYVDTNGKGAEGKWLIIQHPNDYISVYMHLSNILVKPGDTIKSGCLVAQTGKTGTATGPHLDYRIAYKGTFVNPENFLKCK